MSIKKVVAASALACLSVNALAYEAGDFILRAGVASVQPDESSSGTKLGVKNDEELGITGVYMVTKNIGVEVLASTPFTHDVTSGGTVIGEVKHLPPTVSAQYYFDTGSAFTPYVGAGVNYFMVLESETKGSLNGKDLDVDDSVGLAFSAGVDMKLTDDLILNAAVWNIDVDTDVDVNGSKVTDLEIDPWVYMLGVGYKF